MASLAATFAIGNPVAFDASADERDTRGFISITSNRPSCGETANCTFEPPVVDADLTQHGDRSVAHALVLFICQSLCWRDGDRITRMDPHRIEVLDRADDDAVVVLVAKRPPSRTLSNRSPTLRAAPSPVG